MFIGGVRQLETGKRYFVQAHQQKYICSCLNVHLLLAQLATVFNVKWFEADCSKLPEDVQIGVTRSL